MKAGADPNATNSQGLTPLHTVAFRGFIRTAQFLLRHNANIHVKSKDDTSILDMAALGEQTAMLEWLMECDFNFEERFVLLFDFIGGFVRVCRWMKLGAYYVICFIMCLTKTTDVGSI